MSIDQIARQIKITKKATAARMIENIVFFSPLEVFSKYAANKSSMAPSITGPKKATSTEGYVGHPKVLYTNRSKPSKKELLLMAMIQKERDAKLKIDRLKKMTVYHLLLFHFLFIIFYLL